MRIGCLQFAPQVGDIDNNLNRADAVLNKANIDDLDLLVLPELAFSGYNFKSLQHISPYLEPSGSGITSLWARTTALKYNCNVVVGYPEKADVTTNWPTGPEYYNSAIVVNGDGETIANYRKSFLYYTDETWALEGNQGFFEGWIPGLGNTSIGICMDLNPYRFQAPWHAFEFAFHVLEYESNLVIVSMAWMTREDGRMFSRMPNEPDMDTLTYWVTRLEPLIRAENEDEIIVVFCNRTGIEDEAVYAGTSAVVGVQSGEVKIYGLLGRGEKELLVVDTNNPPYAKLVYRPEPERPSAVHSELLQTGSSPSSTTASASGASSLAGGPKQGFSSHTPTQPTSPPNGKSSASTASSKKSSKKLPTAKQVKVPAKIKIPPTNAIPGSMFHGDSMRSPGSESINLPTPTAPSPTPQAVRPKLIIPQSPPLAPWQTGSPVPQSSQSTLSLHSVRSNSTITSNPRPPEDSTPYPNSGIPLSGYPARFPERKIYSGDVSISQAPFTPITPFEDRSPLEPRYFWRPPNSALKTPMEPQSRNAVEEPDDTRTQSFPNFALFSQHEPPSRTHSSNTTRTAATAVTARRENEQHLKERKRSASQNTKPRNSSKSRPKQPTATTGRADTATGSSSDDALPARPSSPKSRNASRSRMRERSDSSLAHHEQAAAISQQLESISQRAESVNWNRNYSAGVDGPQPDRPPSPKSRNCSRSRPSEHLSSILIAASPSILGDDGIQRPLSAPQDAHQPTPPRTMSRMSFRARATSITDNERNVRPQSRSSIGGGQHVARPSSRAASRGRQPGPNFSPPKMVPYDPSEPSQQAQDDRVLSTVEGRALLASKEPLTSPASEPTYERVEAVVCPNCPVHGRNSTGSAPDLSGTTGSGHRISPDLNLVRSISSPAPATCSQATEAVAISKIGDNPRFSATNPNKSSDVTSLTETIETISTTSRSPSTPWFEPKTPKAMVLIRDAEDQGMGPLIDLSDGFPDIICTDRHVGPLSDGPKVLAT